jgi:hypothetical protein
MTLVPDDSTGATLQGSAALSLLELRRHLIRRAGELSGRARVLRARGDAKGAAAAAEQAARLRMVARDMERRRGRSAHPG